MPDLLTAAALFLFVFAIVAPFALAWRWLAG